MALITDKAMQARPKKKDIWLTDDAPRGYGRFCGRITKTGERFFYFRYTNANGKRDYISLGKYAPEGKGGLTLLQAREVGEELSRLYRSGVKDIKTHLDEQKCIEEQQKAAEQTRLEAERKEAAARMTVKNLFEEWERRRLSKYKDGGKETSRLFKKDILPAIGHLHAESIRKGHIVQITDAIEDRGSNRMAKIAFSSMRRMFWYALERDHIEFDPTAGLRKSAIGGRDVMRDRVLSEKEITLLAERLPESGLLPPAQAAIWICLSTLCRTGELLKAEWKDVDLKNRVWTIPAENSKNGEPLKIHLTDFNVEQFKIIKSLNHSTGWVFPNRTGKNHVSLKTISHQVWDRQRPVPANKRSQNSEVLLLPGGKWTMHDLRRSGATLMAKLGVKPEEIDRCQNHLEPNRIRRTYQLYDYSSEMKQAWELLSERIEQLIKGDGAKVIQLRSNDRGK